MYLDTNLFVVTDEGEYICPKCTIFGLDKEEAAKLIELFPGKIKDIHKDEEGYEIESSVFKVCYIHICIYYLGGKITLKSLTKLPFWHHSAPKKLISVQF